MQPPEQFTPDGVAPPATLAAAPDLFARRATRLRKLAAGHPHGAWLDWLAALCDAQQQFAAQVTTADAIGIVAQGSSRALAQALLGALAPALPDALRDLPQRLTALDTRHFAHIATSNLQLARGEVSSAARDAASLVIAASQQIAWTLEARTRAASIPAQLATSSTLCPCCGAAPLGSIVLAGAGKAGVRYLECSLCATRWNAVRARCTLCDSTRAVEYLGLEDVDASLAATQAECCPACHGYIKTFFQDKDIGIEPQSDDLATLMLDLLVAEQGYARASPNLLLDALETANR